MQEPISKTRFKAHVLAVMREIEQTGEPRDPARHTYLQANRQLAEEDITLSSARVVKEALGNVFTGNASC